MFGVSSRYNDSIPLTVAAPASVAQHAEDLIPPPQADRRKRDRRIDARDQHALRVAKPDLDMGTVTERLVLRLAATAKRDSVSHLVRETIRGHDLDAAAQPKRAAALLVRILDNTDGHRQHRLHRRAGVLVPRHQPPGRTKLHLPDEGRAHHRIVGVLDLAPDRSVWIAEAAGRAKAPRIGQPHGRTVKHLRHGGIGLARRGFLAVEPHLAVRAIAIRLAPRAAAPAKRVAFPCWKTLALDPAFRTALDIGADDLLGQRDFPGNQIGTIL